MKFNKIKIFFLVSVILIFLLHFVASMYLFQNNPEFFFHNDGGEYYELGINLGEKGEMIIEKARYYEAARAKIIPEAFRFQLLSILLGGLIYIGIAPAFATSLLLASISTLGSILIFKLAKELSGNFAGFMALILFNIHPLLASYSIQFCSEILFTTSLMWIFYCSIKTEEKSTYKWIILSGIAAGISVWIRPTSLVFGGSIALLLFLNQIWNNYKNRTKIFSITLITKPLLYCAVFFICILPIGLRNLHYFQSLSFSGYLGGFNLCLGYHPDNFAAYKSTTGREFLDNQNKAWEKTIATVANMPLEYRENPATQNSYLTSLALEQMNDLGFVNCSYLIFARAWQYIRPWPMRGIHGFCAFWGLTLFDLALFIFGIAGMCILRKNIPLILSSLCIILTGMLAHSIVHVYIRHRVPFVIPILIIFSAFTIDYLRIKLVHCKL